MSDKIISLETGELLDDETELTLADLCRACEVTAEQILALVEEGLVDPLGREPRYWRFHSIHLRRVRCALRLERDLGVNVAGAALAIELLEELESLRAQLRRPGA